MLRRERGLCRPIWLSLFDENKKGERVSKVGRWWLGKGEEGRG